MPLSPRQEDIVELLTRHPYLLDRQIQKALFPRDHADYTKNAKYALRLLQPLCKDKYVVVPKNNREAALAGQAKTLYTIGPAGRKLARRRGWELAEYYRPSEMERQGYYWEHAVAVADLVILIDQLVDAVPEVWIADRLTEKELRRINIRVSDASVDPARTKGTTTDRALIPDYWLRLDIGPTLPVPLKFAAAFEVDRGTEKAPKIQAKIRAYARWLTATGGMLRGVATRTIAFVCPTGDTRAAQVRVWAEEELTRLGTQDLAGHFLFSGTDPAGADALGYFFSPLFRPALDPTPVALLQLPNAEADAEAADA